MTNTIYLITHFQKNHRERRLPINPGFLSREKNFVFYIVDDLVPEELSSYPILFEKEIDPTLHQAGKDFLAEWSFLLAEAKHGVCSYPFFMLSSRFYEKNWLLKYSLNELWDDLFQKFDSYQWGWLPSYDEPLRWVDHSYKRNHKLSKKHWAFAPCTKKAYELVDHLLDLDGYRYCSNFFCSYIGFKDRKHLQQYVDFYRPIFDFFFDPIFQLKVCQDDYITRTGLYRCEFILLVEHFSHLFFYKNKEKFFGLRYDGVYEIDEFNQTINTLNKFDLSLKEKLNLKIREQWSMANKEWWTTPYLRKVRPYLRNVRKFISHLLNIQSLNY